MFGDLKDFVETSGGLLLAAIIVVGTFLALLFQVDLDDAMLIAGALFGLFLVFFSFRVVSFFTGDD